MSMVQVTEISSTAQQNALVLSVDDLRNYYGFKIAEAGEAMFSRMIEAAQKACASYMGVKSLHTMRNVSEWFDSSEGQKDFCLSAGPFASIVSVSDGAVELGLADYRIDTESGVLRLINGAKGKEVRVDYEIGWGSNVPRDVLYCIAMTVQKMAKDSQSARMGEISRSIEGGSENWEQTVVPQAVQSYLERYRFNLAV